MRVKKRKKKISNNINEKWDVAKCDGFDVI